MHKVLLERATFCRPELTSAFYVAHSIFTCLGTEHGQINKSYTVNSPGMPNLLVVYRVGHYFSPPDVTESSRYHQKTRPGCFFARLQKWWHQANATKTHLYGHLGQNHSSICLVYMDLRQNNGSLSGSQDFPLLRRIREEYQPSRNEFALRSLARMPPDWLGRRRTEKVACAALCTAGHSFSQIE